ncbi:MAG: redoxin domain-containing protein [Clostridiales bacterium]|nr:redoxin domain-containing protein [Clostridiales bacterium]
MIRKILCLFIASFLLFALGCNAAGDNTGDNVPAEEPAASETPVVSDTPEAESEPAASTEPEEEPAEPQKPDVPVFNVETTTIEGETFHIPGFAKEHDLTVVNFWATWCGPCVGEMPGLQNLHARFEKGGDNASVAILGVCIDPENESDVKDVLGYTGAAYPNTVFTQDMFQYVDLMYIPATIFLDREGHIVGDPVVGAMDESMWLSEIESRLSTLGLSL